MGVGNAGDAAMKGRILAPKKSRAIDMAVVNSQDIVNWFSRCFYEASRFRTVAGKGENSQIGISSGVIKLVRF